MKMRQGQRLLYELVCKTLADGQPLRRRDYEGLYVSHIRRNARYERDIRWADGTVKEIRRDYYECETKAMAAQWVLNTLGRLVHMGALKVVPQIQLEDIE